MNEIRSGSEQARDDRGKFLKGVSGNPSGRPSGIRDRRVHIREDLLGPLLPNAIQKLSAAVDEGERWAIELVVSYSLPKPRPVDPDEVQEIEDRLSDLEQLTARKHQ
jgi:hypothetical protein